MATCQSCFQQFTVDVDNPPNHCPHCGDALRREPPGGWVPVARVANLAETGYFADTLQREGIVSQVQEVDEYNALLGVWESVYVLQVGRHESQRAVALMRDEMDTEGERTSHAHDVRQETHPAQQPWTTQPMAQPTAVVDWPASDSPAGGSFVRSMALVLVAGGLAYGVGRATAPPRADQTPRDERNTLWQSLSRPGETLTSEGPPGSPRYQVRYDVQSDRIFVDEDVNGDGQYDRRQTFERGRRVVVE